ncbi:hypothetical protein GGI35DRAFT_462332 [Trichoderma velutinum]
MAYVMDESGELEVVPDDDLMAMEVHARCRFMWDTSSFQHDAPLQPGINRNLYDQVKGRVEDNGFFADAVYIGYSMYAESPVFAKKRRPEDSQQAADDELPIRFTPDKPNIGLYLEPGCKRVGSAVIPHFDANTWFNAVALYTWADGNPAERVFGSAVPLEYLVEQAEANAMDLADGKGLMPVTRLHAVDFHKLPEGTVLGKTLVFPDKHGGQHNPCLSKVVCNAALLLRSCPAISGWLYPIPHSEFFQYPAELLEMLRAFAQKYTKDRLTERGLVLATHLWINITTCPGLALERYTFLQSEQGKPYPPVPSISLAQCLIYHPHWLRWISNMGLVEFIHPFRFIHKAVETDLANNPNAGMEVKASDIDEDRAQALMTRVHSASRRNSGQLSGISSYCPSRLPGTRHAPLYNTQGATSRPAPTGVEHVRCLGLPTYAPPRVPKETRPTTFVLVQPKWVMAKVCQQDMVMPYLEYMEKNPSYPGYGFAKRWGRPTLRYLPVLTKRTEEPFVTGEGG